MDDSVLKLENQLCFPLYACAKEVVKQYKPHLDALGLTYTQYITMMVLWEHRCVNVKTIGEQLYLDSGTLTPLLKKLESQGLIARRRDASDDRQVLVELTPQGEALKELAVRVPGQVGRCIPLTQEEAGQLYQLLYRILGRLTETEEK
ncbi:MAG: MarR family transcriptional regulator [Clostridiales bacterium]|nr:MarR family transcriptional regulator [Clostridiales bacterium]